MSDSEVQETILAGLVRKYYQQFMDQVGTPETEQLRIRYHAYAVGFVAHIFEKKITGALNLRGDGLTERLQCIEEILDA